MNLLHANDRSGQYPASYYAATATPLAPFAPLQGEMRADVGIVGGGYAGLSAALYLAARGRRVVLLEAHRVGFGASGRNGGQVGSGQRQDQDWLERSVGREMAHRLWHLAEEAKAMVKTLIKTHAMPVAFHPGVAHVFSTVDQRRHAQTYAERLQRDYGYDHLEVLDRAEMRVIVGSDGFSGGVIDRDAGHIHPLNYAIGLAQAAAKAGAVIHEGSEVHHIEPGAKPVLQTGRGRVICDQVILAGNGYLGNLEPKVAARVMPINNFIIATEPLGSRARDVLAQNIAVADSKFVVNYWRLSEDDRLLFGGGESYGYRFPDIIKTVSKPMLAVYPQLRGTKIDFAWGGTLAITTNRMPYFARPQPNILAASACSGHGVALSTLAGRILAEATEAQSDRFDLMAGMPQMRFPGGVALRWPLLVLAMTWYALRDRLGY
jgi:gamma-glutamylputrescine oxidase